MLFSSLFKLLCSIGRASKHCNTATLFSSSWKIEISHSFTSKCPRLIEKIVLASIFDSFTQSLAHSLKTPHNRKYVLQNIMMNDTKGGCINAKEIFLNCCTLKWIGRQKRFTFLSTDLGIVVCSYNSPFTSQFRLG